MPTMQSDLLPEELASELFTAAGGARREASPEVTLALRQFLADAREAWPALSVDWRAFVRHLGSTHGKPADLAGDIGKLHAADMLLAWACVEGHARAVGELDARYLARLPAYLSHLRLDASAIDDIRQELSRKLLVRDDNHAPRLAAYAGRGTLESWMRVAALRTALSLQRRVKNHTSPDALPEIALGATPDPELGFLKQHHRVDFATAFRVAVTKLSSRDRNLLRLHYLDGVGIGAMAKLYEVHRITMARWLGTLRGKLLERTRVELRAALQLSPSECDSMIEMVGSRFDVTLTSLLKSVDP